MTFRYLILSILAAALFPAACSTPQERSGRSTRPFNEPAAWETNPYGGMFHN